MSRTKNQNRVFIGLYKPSKGKIGIIGKNIHTEARKMKPMLGGKRRNYGKFKYSDGDDVPISYKTKALKLELKNANRSVKKAERQKSKIEISLQIDGL